MESDKCPIHGKVSYISVPSKGVKVCKSCLEAGFYIDEVFAEATKEDPTLELKV